MSENNEIIRKETTTETMSETAATPQTATADKKNTKKKRSHSDAIEKVIAELNKPSDEFDTFGEYIASEFRSLQFDHNTRKLKRIIQKAVLDISEIDDNERSSSVFSTHSHASNNSKNLEAFTSVYSVYSPLSTIQPINQYSQTSCSVPLAPSSSSCSNSNSSSFQYFQDLEMSSSGIVQYVVIRGDLIKELKWPLGAVIAQACHAVTAVTYLFREDVVTQEYLKDLDNMHKVVLEASDDKSLITLKNSLEENAIKYKLWIEQPENIPTCLVVKPYPKEEVQKYFKKLKLYKS